MGGKNDEFGRMITVTGADPEALESLIGSAKRNRAAMSRKQKYDAARVRVRVDVPTWVRDTLAEEAKELGTSVNDLGTVLLAWALADYFDEDEELHELLDFEDSRSPRKRVAIDPALVLDRLRESVARAAKTSPSAKEVVSNGADNGADERGHWLEA